MEKASLNVYCLGGPLLSTEWVGLMSDKYREHMSFTPVIVATPEEAQVIVWDGVTTPKSRRLIRELLDAVSGKVVFLLTGEGATFFQDHPFVRLNRREISSVHLPPSRVLPEEILEALEECRQKAGHV
jgi:Ni,Fe-hydrogenase III small subunit